MYTQDELDSAGLTDAQMRVMKEWVAGKTKSAIAREFDHDIKTIWSHIEKSKAKLAKIGLARDHDMDNQAAPGFAVKGTSTLYDEDGNVKVQWVKTDRDKEQMEDDLRIMVDAFKEEIKPTKRIPKPKKKSKDNLLNLYTLTDFHLGMLAWHEEVGEGNDWDLDIAERTMLDAFRYLLDNTPDAEVGFFNELGDFEHYDSHVAVTPMNQHILDADGRPTKMIRTSIRVQRQVIEMMAEKYPKVVVLNAEGNHNIISSVWKRELFAEFYRNNPRIEVITDVLPYYAYEWGVNMLGFHHGHMKRGHSSSEVFLSTYREMYGRTKNLHIHAGHMHHRDVKEKSTHIWEMHPTLAAPDAYAARGGWNSQRAMQTITYHKEFMETGRTIVRPEML